MTRTSMIAGGALGAVVALGAGCEINVAFHSAHGHQEGGTGGEGGSGGGGQGGDLAAGCGPSSALEGQAEVLWEMSFFPKGASITYPFSIATDPGGNIVVVGATDGDDRVPTPVGSTPPSPADPFHTFLAKFDAAGKHLWSWDFPIDGTDKQQVATDGVGNIYLAGAFNPPYSRPPAEQGTSMCAHASLGVPAAARRLRASYEAAARGPVGAMGMI